jgi:two-component system chemotaxis response regulator CheY
MSYNFLIVDDSLPMRSVIIKTIKASGFGQASYYQAGNGLEALDVLKNEWLDLVVTDYNMPQMDGMILIRKMQQDDLWREIPILVVTTEGSQNKVTEFMQEGAVGYIKKPFTPEAIREKLTEILGEPSDDDFVEEDDGDFDF